MYIVDTLYRSVVRYTQTLVPSGIVVVDGEQYGVRADDPSDQSPSVAVTLGNMQEVGIELGSNSVQVPAIFTIHAKSRFQRDVLISILLSGLFNKQIPLYSAFSGFVPTGDPSNYLGFAGYINTQNMPNFESDRERFFWSAVVYVTLSSFV